MAKLDPPADAGVPEFTGLLDAAVPAEKVVLSHQLDGSGQWFAASKASDGRYFFGRAATEPLARRAAGLRTLAHLKSRAGGNFEGLSEEEIEAARLELISCLREIEKLITGFNGDFPAGTSRQLLLVRAKSSRELIEAKPERGIVVRWVAPAVFFFAGAFAEGVMAHMRRRLWRL
ncbi:hypothetical protein [Sphingomonas sp.]|jgi:hypothetical protein|uniref:hypothetical protein n=1 Tax=Sphingomonas sp. TaxID=28214 RepID=UPI002EDB48B5